MSFIVYLTCFIVCKAINGVFSLKLKLLKLPAPLRLSPFHAPPSGGAFFYKKTKGSEKDYRMAKDPKILETIFYDHRN